MPGTQERVNAIALPPAEDTRHDSDLFLQGAGGPEFQKMTVAVIKRGFQTRAAELDLGHVLGDIAAMLSSDRDK